MSSDSTYYLLCHFYPYNLNLDSSLLLKKEEERNSFSFVSFGKLASESDRCESYPFHLRGKKVKQYIST